MTLADILKKVRTLDEPRKAELIARNDDGTLTDQDREELVYHLVHLMEVVNTEVKTAERLLAAI